MTPLLFFVGFVRADIIFSNFPIYISKLVQAWTVEIFASFLSKLFVMMFCNLSGLDWSADFRVENEFS